MIEYDLGTWSFGLLLHLRGSVIPKASLIALGSAVLCFLYALLVRNTDFGKELKNQMEGLQGVWAGYTTVLGVFLCFRNDQAKQNFDKGTNGITVLHGEWFHSVSSLFAYCSKDPEQKQAVTTFQYSLVRLASALHCFALQQVCDMDDDTLEIIKIDGMDSTSRGVLGEVHDRCELIVQWMKHLILKAHAAKVIRVQGPVLSGFLTTIGRGMVSLSKMRNIAEIRFPFPYLQTLVTMLSIHWLVTPLIAACVIESWWVGAILVFLCVASLWSLHYIANELDQPFGEDANDLPVKQMQQDFNRSLLMLLDTRAETAPSFKIDHEHLPHTALAASSDTSLGAAHGLTSVHHRYSEIQKEDQARESLHHH